MARTSIVRSIFLPCRSILNCFHVSLVKSPPPSSLLTYTCVFIQTTLKITKTYTSTYTDSKHEARNTKHETRNTLMITVRLQEHIPRINRRCACKYQKKLPHVWAFFFAALRSPCVWTVRSLFFALFLPLSSLSSLIDSFLLFLLGEMIISIDVEPDFPRIFRHTEHGCARITKRL